MIALLQTQGLSFTLDLPHYRSHLTNSEISFHNCEIYFINYEIRQKRIGFLWLKKRLKEWLEAEKIGKKNNKNKHIQYRRVGQTTRFHRSNDTLS
jgi:hypothetical protein